MPLDLTYTHPDFLKGTEFDLEGILVKNGESTKVDDDQIAMFEAKHGGVSIKDYFKDSNNVKLGKGGD